nr:MAG TPA: hypothetical protein [Caudoviricetes sp.]
MKKIQKSIIKNVSYKLVKTSYALLSIAMRNIHIIYRNCLKAFIYSAFRLHL